MKLPNLRRRGPRPGTAAALFRLIAQAAVPRLWRRFGLRPLVVALAVALTVALVHDAPAAGHANQNVTAVGYSQPHTGAAAAGGCRPSDFNCNGPNTCGASCFGGGASADFGGPVEGSTCHGGDGHIINGICAYPVPGPSRKTGPSKPSGPAKPVSPPPSMRRAKPIGPPPNIQRAQPIGLANIVPANPSGPAKGSNPGRTPVKPAKPGTKSNTGRATNTTSGKKAGPVKNGGPGKNTGLAKGSSPGRTPVKPAKPSTKSNTGPGQTDSKTGPHQPLVPIDGAVGLPAVLKMLPPWMNPDDPWPSITAHVDPADLPAVQGLIEQAAGQIQVRVPADSSWWKVIGKYWWIPVVIAAIAAGWKIFGPGAKSKPMPGTPAKNPPIQVSKPGILDRSQWDGDPKAMDVAIKVVNKGCKVTMQRRDPGSQRKQPDAVVNCNPDVKGSKSQAAEFKQLDRDTKVPSGAVDRIVEAADQLKDQVGAGQGVVIIDGQKPRLTMADARKAYQGALKRLAKAIPRRIGFILADGSLFWMPDDRIQQIA